MTKNIRIFFRRDDGAAAVEFSMLALLFVSLILGIFEMGRLLWTLNGIQYASEQAARFAAIQTDETEEEIRTVLTDALQGLSIPTSEIEVTVDYVSVNSIDMVQVNARYPFTLSTLFFLSESLRSFDLTALSRRAELPE